MPFYTDRAMPRDPLQGPAAAPCGDHDRDRDTIHIHGQMRKVLVDNPNDKLTVAQTCIAGGGAGFMVSFVLTPIELVKCRMQMANAPYVGPNIRMLCTYGR